MIQRFEEFFKNSDPVNFSSDFLLRDKHISSRTFSWTLSYQHLLFRQGFGRVTLLYFAANPIDDISLLDGWSL